MFGDSFYIQVKAARKVLDVGRSHADRYSLLV